MPDTLEPALEAALDPKALQAAWKAFGKHAFYEEHLVAGIRAYLAAASPQAEIDRLREALRESIRQLDVIIEDGIPTDFRMWRDDLKTAIHPETPQRRR